MKGRSFLFFLLFCELSSAADLYYHPADGVDGTELCCQEAYFPCYKSCPRPQRCPQCPPWDGCVKKCDEKHCQEKKTICAKIPEPAQLHETFSFEGPKTITPGSKRIRFDGRLPGPGVITFHAINADKIHALNVNGVVYGRDKKGAVTFLKKSHLQGIPSKEHREFTLTVSKEEFGDWTRRFGPLTIALSIPPEHGGHHWRYENRLTEKDKERAKQDEYFVKGAFFRINK